MALDSLLYNEICYSLLLLKEKWIHFVEVENHERNKLSGGLKGRARRFFNREIEQELSDSVCEMAVQLSKDWSFLNMFLHSIRKWSDADVLMLKSGQRQSSALRISALALGIDEEIKACDYGRLYYLRPDKLLSFLGYCRRKTDEFLTEDAAGVVQYISSLKFQVTCPDVPFWDSFVDSVRRNLQSIRDDLDGPVKTQIFILGEEIELLQRYIYHVQTSLRSENFEFAEHHFIKKFLTHVASVIVRIANQSCHFWFSRAGTETATAKANVLVDLQHKIDPANPEFIRLNLIFYRDLYKMGSNPGLGFFSSFLLTSCGNYNLRKELISLVTLFINSSLMNQSFRDDVHYFFAEIYALFAEAAFLHHSAYQENETADLCPAPELLTKICLLKVELVLKEQLDRSASSITLQNLESLTDGLCLQLRASLGEKNLALAEEVANEVESLYASLNFNSITVTRVKLPKHFLHILLYKLLFFKAESFLIELMKKGDILVPYEKGILESLLEELRNLKPIISNSLVTHSSYEIMLFVESEAVCRRINQFYCSFLSESDKLKTLMHLLPQLLNKVRGIMEKFKQASSEFPVSNFPKTCELGFIDFLQRNIKMLLKYDSKSIEPVKPHLDELKLHLKSMKSFLVKVSDLDVEEGELTDLRNHIRDVAYKLEYVVELFEVKSHWQHSIWLYFLLEDIRLVSKRVRDIPGESCASKFKSLQQNSSGMVLKYNMSEIDEMWVDLSDEEEVIIEQLTRGSLQRNVVSIVGMPGIGKTTLAGKVYSSQIILHHFHRRAWCNVSLTYSKRELLLEILSDIHGLTDEIHRMSNEDLQAKLRQCLLKNRYLIVMDDVWDDAVWIDLESVFPNDANGSRILITSRLQDVAAKIKPDCVPYSIRLFSDEESWMLLEKKTFDGKPCPEELLSVGKEIAQLCQGLPLAVVAIAGLLRKTEKRRDCWKRISRSLSSLIMKDPENRCMEILELSYNHLPGYLKVCFLYLGVFLEEKDISVTKLIWFWMAEGFILETDYKSLEDVAEDYLMELINRSLVIVTKTRSNGKVKACRLHDLLRDLCHSKAKEDYFFQLVTKSDEPYASFPVSDYDMEFHNSHELRPMAFESYRLSIFLKRNHFIDSRPSGQGTRSLIFSALDDSEPRCPYDISFILNNFKLLRVLYLECINMGVSFPVEIGLMVHLRLLAVSGYVKSIPSSIANLWKLETLIVKGFRGRVILPDSIWRLARLRHLHVNNHVAFQVPGEKKNESSIHLDNMVSFSTPSFSCKEDTICILRRFPNLLKLRCIFLESWDSKNDCNQFPSLEFFKHLESLKMIYHGRSLRPGKLNLPLSLKNLTLSSFRLPWSHISAMARLPNLTVLKLIAGAFEGPKWEMDEEEFKELRFLKLEALNIAEWNASSDHFPRLEHLVVRNCKDLKGIPHDFAFINTLLTIEVQWCGQAVEESAREIGDETGEVEILITHSHVL